MTGTEAFAVVGAVIAWIVSVRLGIRAYQQARAMMNMSKSLDEAAVLLEEPEQ